jgi:phospholipid/cholesterol/gamma-HCH transport system permease protein
MRVPAASHHGLARLGRAGWRSATDWWGVVHFGALALAVALSPSTYDSENTARIARRIYISTWQVLLWFTVLCALISLVLIRIVMVTALSYGLSQYALEMVVRVLVLELIPLGAALFVLLRSGLAAHSGLSLESGRKGWQASGPLAHETLRCDLVPRMIAIAFSVLTLAAVSSLVALVLAYGVAYGFSPWGLGPYTRMVGRVFDPAVTLLFGLKTLLFSLAVAVVPVASAVQAQEEPDARTRAVPQGTVRLFLVLVLIEAASLAIKYI